MKKVVIILLSAILVVAILILVNVSDKPANTHYYYKDKYSTAVEDNCELFKKNYPAIAKNWTSGKISREVCESAIDSIKILREDLLRKNKNRDLLLNGAYDSYSAYENKYFNKDKNFKAYLDLRKRANELSSEMADIEIAIFHQFYKARVTPDFEPAFYVMAE